MAAAVQRFTITGSAGAGFTWTCGTCGASAVKTQATRAASLIAYDVHYANAPSLQVDPWILALLTAGQNLSAAVTADPAQATAWTTALQSGPQG